MSHDCPPTETKRVGATSRLELKCSSSCRVPTSYAKFEWVKNSKSEEGGVTAALLESQDSTLVIESVDYQDGGTYKCRCLPDGPQCEERVYSK